MTITKTEFAVRHWVVQSQVSRWIRAGLPVRDDGKLAVDECDGWLIAYEASWKERHANGWKNPPAAGPVWNAEKRKAYQREYYRKNRDHCMEMSRTYAKANRSIINAQKRERNRLNPEKARLHRNKSRNKDIEKTRAQNRFYYYRARALSPEKFREREQRVYAARKQTRTLTQLIAFGSVINNLKPKEQNAANNI